MLGSQLRQTSLAFFSCEFQRVALNDSKRLPVASTMVAVSIELLRTEDTRRLTFDMVRSHVEL